MGKRPKKKVILVLVEGKSDINALSYALPKFFADVNPEYEVYFPIISDVNQEGGDITAKYGVNPRTIEMCINKLFLHDFLKNEGLYPKDITEIIQIVDTDGAFISSDRIISPEETASDNIRYEDDAIRTKKRELIIERNERKVENLNYLTELNSIKADSKTVKYSVYYFSCNLDHFLHGDANMDKRDKCTKADEFALRCMDDISVFKDTFLYPGDGTEELDYEESWDFIKQGTNSLGRHSNLHVLIKRIMQDAEDN